MEKVKQKAKPKPGASARRPGSKPVKPSTSKPPKPKVRVPLTDEQVGPIPGLPTEAEIEQQAGELSAPDKAAFTKIRRLLAERLGSHAAARAWLVAPGHGFEGTPLQAIRAGMAKRVLEVVKAQMSRNPPYA
jgi:hypothetical protein